MRLEHQCGAITVSPRLIRFRDAPNYLGMDRNRFNQEVRPLLTVIPIGRQGVAFDRLEMDAWVEQYKTCNGRPGRTLGGSIWDEKERQGSSRERVPGTSTSAFADGAFARALAQVNSKKPSDS